MAAGSVTKKVFGALPDGLTVRAFTLSLGELSATVVEYGATLTSLLVPGRAATPRCTLPSLFRWSPRTATRGFRARSTLP